MKRLLCLFSHDYEIKKVIEFPKWDVTEYREECKRCGKRVTYDHYFGYTDGWW